MLAISDLNPSVYNFHGLNLSLVFSFLSVFSPGCSKDNDEERGASRCGTHLVGTVQVSSIITADGGEQLYVT